MGENEQGGMLRVVTVIGLIAMIAAVVIFAITGLKGNMKSNTNTAVGSVSRITLPHKVDNPNVTFMPYPNGVANNGYWGDHLHLFPVVGDIPPNNWREVRMVVKSDKPFWTMGDISANSIENVGKTNDNDKAAAREMTIYEDGKKIYHDVGNAALVAKRYYKANQEYTLVFKYFNDKPYTFNEGNGVPRNQNWYSGLFTGSTDNGKYNFQILNFEAATYDDEYYVAD